MMLPRMFLHCPPRGGSVSRDKLVRRFDMFSRVVEASAVCNLQAAVGRRRRRKRPGDDDWAAKVECWGELSFAWQALGCFRRFWFRQNSGNVV